MKVKVAHSCPTLCDSMDYTVHGILQARILEWVAFPFSRRSSQSRDQTQVSALHADFLPAEPQTIPKRFSPGSTQMSSWTPFLSLQGLRFYWARLGWSWLVPYLHVQRTIYILNPCCVLGLHFDDCQVVKFRIFPRNSKQFTFQIASFLKFLFLTITVLRKLSSFGISWRNVKWPL